MSPRPDVVPRPRVRWAALRAVSNDADDATFLSSAYGLIPDQWQSPILSDWMSRRGDGQWCYGRCGLAVPRQNGKNGILEIRELFGMVVLGEAVLHAAHEVKTTKKAFKRLKYFFGSKKDDPNARFSDLNALVAEVRSTNGQEGIFLKDVCRSCTKTTDVCRCEAPDVRPGGSVEFIARSSGSGRGYTVDLLVLDEAQHLDDDELEAIRSTVSSGPTGNPQVIYTGTPPNREKGALGVVWLRIRSGANKAKRLTWTEYGAADGPMPDIDDIELLFEVNPALELRHGNGAYGLRMDVVRDEREDLSPEGYARERYGWWGNPETVRRGVIEMDRFRALKVDAQAPTVGQVVVDVSPDLEWTSISVASGLEVEDGQVHGLPVHRTLVLVDRLEGTESAPSRVEALVGGLARVVEVALTPTAKLLSPELTRLGIKHEVLTNAEVGQGCVKFQEMVRHGAVAHVGQQELNDAARNSVTRYISDAQHWDRRERSIDISPLVAGSVAAQRWVLNTAAPENPPPAPRRARRTKGRAIDRVSF